MKNLEQLKKAVETAKENHDKAMSELLAFDSGYKWIVTVYAYGSKKSQVFSNVIPVNNLIEEYGDGYDGMLDIFTNDPETPIATDWGCVSKFKVVTLEELGEIDMRCISKSEAYTNTMLAHLEK